MKTTATAVTTIIAMTAVLLFGGDWAALGVFVGVIGIILTVIIAAIDE